jgi:ATP-dependent helicase/nuclease subunit A
VKTGDLFGVDERLAEYERWRDERAGTIARAQQPALRVQTATAWAAEAATTGVDTLIAESADITVVALPGNADRPRGPRFGTLVHAILATLPLNADDDLVERGARVQARIFNAPADELGAAIDVVTRVLGHELLARARASSAVKRETPVSWVQKDGALIEGVLDLAFDEGDATVVVDFKTDHELAAGETRYRAQLQQYLGAVSKATGRPARGVLFRV